MSRENLITVEGKFDKDPILYEAKALENTLSVTLSAPTLSEAQKAANGVNIMMVLDTSGSMGFGSKPPIDALKKAAISLVKRVRNNVDKIGIVFFSDEIKSEGTKLQAKTAAMDSNSSGFIEAINMIKAEGGTHMHSGLEEAYKQLLNAGNKNRNVIVVMTDGDVNEEVKMTREDDGWQIYEGEFSKCRFNPKNSEQQWSTDTAKRDSKYKKIIEKIAAADIKVRVVPLFSDSKEAPPPDHKFLRDILDSENRVLNVEADDVKVLNIEQKLSDAFAEIFVLSSSYAAQNLSFCLSPTKINAENSFQIVSVEHSKEGQNMTELKAVGNRYHIDNFKSGETHTVFVKFKSQLTEAMAPDRGTPNVEKTVIIMDLSYTDASGQSVSKCLTMMPNPGTKKLQLTEAEKISFKVVYTANINNVRGGVVIKDLTTSLLNTQASTVVLKIGNSILDQLKEGYIHPNTRDEYIASLETLRDRWSKDQKIPEGLKLIVLQSLAQGIANAKNNTLQPGVVRRIDELVTKIAKRDYV